MFRKPRNVSVELSTPQGRVFTAEAMSIDVRTEDGSVHITPRDQSYLNMVHATEITLQTAGGVVAFILENAVGGLRKGHFTVLAETIRRIQPYPASNPST